MYKPVIRNFNGIQHESLRKMVDDKFNLAHDELTSAYYDYWKKGLSHLWQGYDVKGTSQDSKLQFDKLHALIFHKREIALYETNEMIEIKDVDITEMNNKRIDGKKRIDFIKDQLSELADTGIDIVI